MGKYTKILIRCSVAIPITVIIFMFFFPVTICFLGLDIYLSYRTVIFGFVVLTVFWLTFTPVRNSCCNGKWPELLFNLIPVSVLNLFLFAQWHLKIAVVLLVVYIILELFVLWDFASDIKSKKTTAEKKRNSVALKRLSILFLAAVCAFPSAAVITVYGWESPTYEPDQDSLYAVNDESVTDIYQDNIELIECFSDDKWPLLSAEERITLLQSLESLEAQILGIPSVEVLSGLLDENTLASYDNGTNQVCIDIRVLSESTADTCIEGICHETFHAYQYYIVLNMDWESELSQSFYFSEARSWMENTQNYIYASTSGYDSYAEQPLEVDARAYAEEETQRIFSYINR